MNHFSTVRKLTGITFAKQFPNSAEPLRGLFVGEQVRATANDVNWRIIAPVPWVPERFARVFDKPFVLGNGSFDGIQVAHPRYPVLPARVLYSTVGRSVACASRRMFFEASKGAQFVHAHDIYPSGAAVRRLAVPLGLPIVLTVHGSDLYTNVVRRLWEAEVRASVSAADVVICVGKGLARDVVTLAGADPSRVIVIPDTYDAKRFTYTERPVLAGRPIRLVTVGRLVMVKGHDVLIRALGVVVRAGLDITLDIVGGGPEQKTLEGMTAKHGVTDRVTFMGALDNEDLPRVFKQADVFVLPSRREGFGVALVEALATGLPALATCSGGPEDIVTEGDGLLVKPDDVDALAAGLCELYKRLTSYDPRAIALRIEERFGPERVRRQLLEAYQLALVTKRGVV